MKVFRIIGNEGRITIPYSIRQAVGFLPDDVVSFQLMDSDSVLVRREALCEKEKTASVSKPDTNLIEYLESLSPKEQFTALVHLSDLQCQGQACVAAPDTMLHFPQSGKFRQCPGSSFPHEGRSPSWAPLKYNFYTKGFVCMKNITKAIALCLALLLCLSFPISASALEVNNTTIDTDAKGSLTIYKIDLTNAEKDGVWDSSYLGLYLLVETKVPEMVTSTCNPFFLSLPMTSVNGTNAGDGGTRWVYDVTIYPKNLTGIPSLEKTLREYKNDTGNNQGSTSSITDGYAHTGTASDGDVVDYQIVSTLPSITSESTYLTCYTFIDNGLRPGNEFYHVHGAFQAERVPGYRAGAGAVFRWRHRRRAVRPGEMRHLSNPPGGGRNKEFRSQSDDSEPGPGAVFRGKRAWRKAPQPGGVLL